jgi:hypothetical protein
MISRRNFFSKAAVVAGAAALALLLALCTGQSLLHRRPKIPRISRANTQAVRQEYPPGEPGKDYTPVIVSNGLTLPYKVVGGVKVF